MSFCWDSVECYQKAPSRLFLGHTHEILGRTREEADTSAIGFVELACLIDYTNPLEEGFS
jgi:hypothetical protein